MDFTTLRSDAEYFAKEAGTLLCKLQKQARITVEKGTHDYATSADQASEELLLSRIQGKYPGHNILSEEKGIIDHGSDYTWIVDPLDCTKEYFRQLPEFNVLLAVEYKGEIVVGVIYMPANKDIYAAAKEAGATCNGIPIHVSSVARLSQSIVGTYLIAKRSTQMQKDQYYKTLELLRDKVLATRPIFDETWMMTRLAIGGYDGFYFPGFNLGGWWDVAPGFLIVEEAGGLVTNTKGEKIVHRDISDGVVISNKKIHKALLALYN